MKNPYAMAIFSVVLFVAANSLAVRFGETRRIAVLAACGVTATLAFAAFGYVGANKGLAVTSAFVDVLIVIGSVLFGVVFRSERLTVIQCLGIVLGIVATGMILIGAPANQATDIH